MNRCFRLGVVLCGLMNGDFIVSCYDETCNENPQILTAIITAQINADKVRSEQDCSTSGTPKKPTPPTKDSSDDLYGSAFFSQESVINLFLDKTVETSNLSSEKQSPSESPALS